MGFKIEDLRRRKNVLKVLACFENKPFSRFKDIKEICGKKVIKTKGRTEGLEDEQISRVLKWLVEIEFIKKENGGYKSVNRYYNVFQRANDEIFLDKYSIKDTIFLPKLSIYGLKKDYLKNIKISQIAESIEKQINKLLEEKKKMKSRKIRKRYYDELKNIEGRKLRNFLKTYSDEIMKLLINYDFSDTAIKKFIPNITFIKNRKGRPSVKNIKKIILSNKEKEEIGNFCIEVVKGIREEFAPTEIAFLCRSNKRNIADDLYAISRFNSLR